jgi:hypothetical protein
MDGKKRKIKLVKYLWEGTDRGTEEKNGTKNYRKSKTREIMRSFVKFLCALSIFFKLFNNFCFIYL